MANTGIERRALADCLDLALPVADARELSGADLMALSGTYRQPLATYEFVAAGFGLNATVREHGVQEPGRNSRTQGYKILLPVAHVSPVWSLPRLVLLTEWHKDAPTSAAVVLGTEARVLTCSTESSSRAVLEALDGRDVHLQEISNFLHATSRDSEHEHLS